MSEPVHVVSVGSFGRAVARRLRSLRRDVVETAGEDAAAAAEWPAARIGVVAAWRPVPDLCDSSDEESHRRGRPFLPLVVESATLCLGPVIVPGAGSCWRCWVRRTHQHAPGSSRRLALWRHYAGDSGAGPQGYLEPFAAVAAARVSQIVDALDAHEPVAGQVWQMHMITRRITTATLVGVHACPRCGLRREARTRSHAEMQRALAPLWSALVGGGH